MKPTRQTLLLMGVLLLLSLGAPFSPQLYQLWAWAGTCLLLVFALDLWGSTRHPLPQLSRTVDQALPLGVWSQVKLRFDHRGHRPLDLIAYDFHPHQLESERLPLHFHLPPGEWLERSYRIRPVARGQFTFPKCHLLLRSPLGFWFRSLFLAVESQVRVYPNFQAVAKYTMLATHQNLRQIGIHQRRKRGEGREFHQLRDFIPGDSLRKIDWRATSRRSKLISKEYQDERDQRVIFLMDCGQSMRAKDGELSHFDHALNAVLLMTKVALNHGDAIGLMTFSGVHRWLAARKGSGQLNLILKTVFDVQPTLHTSDFLEMAQKILVHVKKRSLLVLVTNLRDEDEGELGTALRLLGRKHLVLLASMREKVVHEVLEQPIETFDDALRATATQSYLENRRRVYELLKAKGIRCLDTVPDQLPVAMVNHYLDIKGRGLL